MLLKMERTKISILILIASVLAMISKSNSQYRPAPAMPFPTFPALRPLCLSQFALVNHACSMIPYSPMPPPAPPSPPTPAPPAQPPCPPKNGHRHGHHHRHRHSGSSHVNAAADECCRWLKEVDTQCVCDLLVRLPVFLAKPAHDYTVAVSDDCSVTYQCPGRVMMT
ncbi:2S albumin [Bienertia sinuspersici]